MIEASGLCKSYQDVVAIDQVGFSVAEGEIAAFLGPNGAGKTTTMRILTGAIPASAGTVKVAGFDVCHQPSEVKRRIGYLPEVPPLYPDLTVREYLRFVGKLKRLAGERLRSEVERVAARAQLGEVIDRLIRGISRGFRQRVGLAQALLGDPPVLILDEPTAGLDPRQIGEVRDIIRSLAGEHTVLLSTHILQEVTATCERVIMLSRGRVVADARLDELVRRESGSGDTASLEQIFLRLTEQP